MRHELSDVARLRQVVAMNPSFAAAGRRTKDELAAGDWVSFDVVLGEAEVDAFASLTQDRSPIHVSREYAVAAGFQSRIVHGMLAASYLSTMVGMFLPGRNAMLMATKMDFVEPITVGARVTVSARVQQVSAATEAATLSVIVLQGGLVALRATVTTRVREGL
jgi:acyl dehydratase